MSVLNRNKPRAHTLKFLKQTITSPVSTGAIAPSSQTLAKRVTEMAGVRDAKVVVEFGPGTGVITRAICEDLQPEALFFAMEINGSFVKTMRKQFPDVTVHHDSAEHTRKYLEQAGAQSCDSIVSGLPWTAFGENLQDSLLDTVQDVLRPGGRFATYMYLHCPVVPTGKRFMSKLRERFGNLERTAVVWKNMPPAFVLWVTR